MELNSRKMLIVIVLTIINLIIMKINVHKHKKIIQQIQNEIIFIKIILQIQIYFKKAIKLSINSFN